MKKYFFILLILFTFTLSYSCKKDNTTSKDTYTHTITIKDSLDIRMPGSIDISFIKNDIDENVLYGLQKNEIIKVDLNAKQFSGKIEIPSLKSLKSTKLLSIFFILKRKTLK